MDNSLILENLKKRYPNLKDFMIRDNQLIFNGNNINNIENINFNNINEYIFLLGPNQIIQIINMYILLNKNNLNDDEKQYIINFMNEYYKIKDYNLEGNNTNELYLFCLELLINDSYNLASLNMPGALLIEDIIERKNNELSSGKSNSAKLILKKESNPDFLIPEEYDNSKEFEKAGFTTILLITITAISTLLYIAFFIANH